ncbi:glycosyl transferase, family 2 [Nitrobacter hamburgensis X14]|uniref:Glycosyl transferase, family 2 n=1 Tax=Nitrobacter hamburgensis (strain DSM 10229 / NCIMB 13809 / X14) TaxID=323097 RepID=Q1QJ06_NITHX|nr:glycosyltransferase [Nitrobacter hamburgensis]ABE63791.1 glycosyl transferase, family 2 [Nitrobacter hamburgensis X14]
MDSDGPLISVVIPHLNQAGDLGACLASLQSQRLSPALFEIIVIDNGSTSPPVEVMARYPSARLLHEPEPGPGPARNAGVRHATGEILAFIDADCRADPDWLLNVAQALRSLPGKTIVGGDVRIWPRNKETLTAVEAYESVFGFRNKLYIERHGYSITANLSARRADLDKIEPFVGIQFAEDMEWGERARSAGFQFHFLPNAIVFHPARRSLRELCVKWDRQIQHYLNMAQGKPAWKLRWVLRSVAVLGSPIIDLATVVSSDRIHGVTTRLKAIMILVAIRAHRARKMLSLLRQSNTVLWNRSAGV